MPEPLDTFPDDVAALTKSCWKLDAAERPDLAAVVEDLEAIRMYFGRRRRKQGVSLDAVSAPPARVPKLAKVKSWSNFLHRY